jgi:hypothetical protein
MHDFNGLNNVMYYLKFKQMNQSNSIQFNSELFNTGCIVKSVIVQQVLLEHGGSLIAQGIRMSIDVILHAIYHLQVQLYAHFNLADILVHASIVKEMARKRDVAKGKQSDVIWILYAFSIWLRMARVNS